jgi:cytoskeletal protein CcmA (bactofilin family)
LQETLNMDKKPADPKENSVRPEGDSLESAPIGNLDESELSKNAQPVANTSPPKDRATWQRIFNLNNKFFVIFVVLLVLVSAITYLVLNAAKKSNPGAASSKVQSLTAQQLSAISGSTTLVGDAQQTLDVQSNSVFEGQVLLRSNLDVAGTIKVGGGLSLPSVTVGGVSSFGQAQINGTLSVAGDTNLQGQVTIEKNLTVSGSGSFGTLSASQFSVSSLQLTGDLTISHHIVFSGSAPSRSNGGALGSGGTASINGSDTGGTVAVNTGGGPAIGCFVTINFAQKFNSTPRVIISPSNSFAGSLEYYTTRSTTSFSLCTNSSPAAATNYVFDYIVFD